MNIYFDNNATTMVDPRVRDAMLPWLGSEFGNPSSVHIHGQRARHAVDNARIQVAALLNAQPEEITFTSGGTEACNAALLGHCRIKGDASRILASRVEHPAVLRCVEYLSETALAKTEWIDVTTDGVISTVDLEQKMAFHPTLVSAMSVNNDVGTIMPIQDLSAIAHGHGAIFHTDAVQAVGKIPVDVVDWNVDMLSFSAHKFRGPKGVGALYIKRGTRWLPTFFGGHQESRKRPGTENVAAIVGFGVACELAQRELTAQQATVAALKAQLETGLQSMAHVWIFGQGAERLGGTCYAGFEGVEGETLQMALDMAGFSVSVGSACSSESRDPSHVLTAMGVPWRDAVRAIRFSIGPDNTSDEIDQLLRALRDILTQLRKS